MSGKAKIESLTRSWYGVAAFSAVISVLTNGIGVLTILGAAFGFVVSVVVAFGFGRWLLSRSSFARVLLLVLSSLATIGGVYTAGKMTMSLFDSFSLAAIGAIVMSSLGVVMNFRSARTLLDRDVKSYCNGG